MLCLVFSLGGMSLLLSRDALPGDPLYGIKRTAEAASLGLTFGDEPKALKHLEFATSRVSEMEALAARYSADNAPVGAYLSALTDFENDATAGTRQLIAFTTQNDGKLLGTLSSWASQQRERLTTIVPRLPGSVRDRQNSTVGLLAKITGRADALGARLDCYQLTTGTADEIGPLPAGSVCDRPSTPGSVPGQETGSRAPADPQQPGTVPGDPAQPGVPDQQATPPTGPQPSTTQPPLVDALPLPDPVLPLPPGSTQPTVPPLVIPLPLPPITVPPLLPGLPPIHVG